MEFNRDNCKMLTFLHLDGAERACSVMSRIFAKINVVAFSDEKDVLIICSSVIYLKKEIVFISKFYELLLS